MPDNAAVGERPGTSKENTSRSIILCVCVFVIKKKKDITSTCPSAHEVNAWHKLLWPC